ncbi:MAG: UvrB/UvrC motif-containing protein [Gemmatimonadota bacterium]|nr:UvrB/UvrC motif-containing protein [Gemmatimonadota bacterium]MDH5284795.1 UvrB/UvrC motif-containing protein [Gemmatimonadota bacterium]
MRCQQCHEREAVVFLTQIAEDQEIHLQLCERCAAEKGVEHAASLDKTPVGTFLALMGKSMDPAAPLGMAPPGACPTCGATMNDFRESGRLGCGDCYRAFEAPLRDLLRRLHGSSRHIGKRYHSPGEDPAASEADREAIRIRDQLERAVRAENFELAAELRDRLRQLAPES